MKMFIKLMSLHVLNGFEDTKIMYVKHFIWNVL